MPYITRERRLALEKGEKPTTPGELNYALSVIVTEYIGAHGLNYAVINAVVGALDCAKQEFYRRVAIPYENAKMAENGDVYDRP